MTKGMELGSVERRSVERIGFVNALTLHPPTLTRSTLYTQAVVNDDAPHVP